MKKTITLFAVLLLAVSAFARNVPDSLGLPGDQLDLFAVIDVFKRSQNPEDFEKLLNTESTHVNNLDLNSDGQVDYIRVIDNMEKDAHALVLQVAVNATQSQDVAVIAIETRGDRTAQLQVIGDSLLYGPHYIVEPGNAQDSATTEKKLRGFSAQQIVFVNVWYWPCVTYVYYPAYVVWVSPWYWMYWPGWWSPWHPVVWVVYYGWVEPYHGHHHHCHEHRMRQAEQVYQPRRVVSADVVRQTAPARSGDQRPAPGTGPQQRPKETTPRTQQPKTAKPPRKNQPSKSPAATPPPAKPREAPQPPAQPKPRPKSQPRPQTQRPR